VKWLYLALDLGALAGPVALSFDRRVAFYRNYRYLFPAIICMMLIFVPWDMAFVAAGIWGFDARYVSGFSLGNLPIEEWLFFPVVSYACLFIYECLKHYVPNNPLERWLTVLGVLYLLRPNYLAMFLLTYLISWVPFLLMNGILTGAFIDGQVVWYSPVHILGLRVGTIPVEDAYYSLMMLLITTVAYEAFRRRTQAILSSQQHR
jgi:lycopene cyclase domain-containing protein